jgi:hypothetical protein
MQSFWKRAVAHNVDLVLVAHEHLYERFARMNDRGRRSSKGTFEFVVGTGGSARPEDGFDSSQMRASRARADRTFGVLLLDLRHPARRGWDFKFRFENVRDKVLDSGWGKCR